MRERAAGLVRRGTAAVLLSALVSTICFFGLLALWTEGAEEGSGGLSGISAYLFSSIPFIAFALLVLGVPAHLLLRRFGIAHFAAYVLLGGIGGYLFGLLLGFEDQLTTPHGWIGPIYGLITAVVARLLIVRGDVCDHADQPAYRG